MIIALDTETSLVSDDEPIPRLVCAQLSDGSSAEIIHQSDPALPSILIDVLSEPVALANAPFDLLVLSERFGERVEDAVWDAYERGRVKDVLTREKLLDLAEGNGLKRPYGLGPVTLRRCGVEIDKSDDTWRKRYVELIDTPIPWWPAEARAYAETDALATHAVWSAQMDRCIALRGETGYDVFESASLQARGHWALHLSSRWGACTDPVAVQALDDSLAAEENRLKEILQGWDLVRPNGSRNMSAVRDMIAAEGGTMMTAGGTKPNKKTGKISPPQIATSDDAISEIESIAQDPEHPLNLYLEYSSVMTTRSRVIKQLRPPIIRTRYEELAANGRSRSTEPNMQNLPSEGGFRECIVPRPGNVLVVADWSKAELVTWAQVLLWLFGPDANTATLADTLRNGGDPHTAMGEAIAASGDYGIPPRRLAKIVNFAFMGGAGAARARNEARAKYRIRLPENTWRALRNAWLRQWHGQRYLDAISAMQHGPDCDGSYGNCTDACTGWIDLVHFKSNRLAGRLSYCDAANYYFSGLAADAGKDCLWRVAKAMYRDRSSDLYGARQIMFVHDEIALECPRERGEKVAAALERIMIDTYAEWCPDVPVKVEIGVMDRYGKP